MEKVSVYHSNRVKPAIHFQNDRLNKSSLERSHTIWGLCYILIWSFYRSFFVRVEKGNLSRQSIRLTIDDDAIIRETNQSPLTRIHRADIKSIIKEVDGGIRIFDTQGNALWIPSDIQDFDQVERLLEEMKPSGAPNEKPFVQAEPPAQSFAEFVQILQHNFSFISMIAFIMVILSYLQLHFYYALFDIGIYSYIDPSEIIFGFANLWKESLVAIVYFIIFHKTLDFIRIKRPTENPSVMDKAKRITSTVQILFFLGTISSMLYFIITSFPKGNEESDVNVLSQIVVLIGCFLTVYGIVITLYFLSLLIKFRERLITVPLTFLGVIIACIIMSTIESYISFKLVTSGHPKYDLQLVLSDGSKFGSDKETFFIGSTGRYYFFGNKKNRNIVIPKSSVIREDQSLLRRGL
jgi:hypothetical protein